jgi:hypothetical protein
MMSEMFETVIFGKGLASQTVSDDLAKATKPLDAFHGEDVSGSVRNGLSGEVLAEMRSGKLHFTVDTQVKILREAAADDPESAKVVIQLGVLDALAGPSSDGEEQFMALMKLMEELYGVEEAIKFITELTVALIGDASLVSMFDLL